MPLTRVTITGADDKTPINELRRLTDQYPFVEWGILIGSRHTERFPSDVWIRTLVEEKQQGGTAMHLSLHCCGSILKSIQDGNSPFMDKIGYAFYSFGRVQLNFHGASLQDHSESILKSFCRTSEHWDPEIICQADGINEHQIKACMRKFACSYLFDCSHGGGVLPSDWPPARSDAACGWAGGLGPDNLEEHLPRINSRAFAALGYWVDMESRVRSGQELDLEKVERCLQIAQKFMRS
jgi:hypothetical protein